MGDFFSKRAIKIDMPASEPALGTSPADDGLHVTPARVGDHEWWYFDVAEPHANCAVKLAAYLGTDVLRRKVLPQLALSARTRTDKIALVQPFPFQDFTAARDFCDVRLKGTFRACAQSPADDKICHVSVDTEEFKANLTFTRQTQGCRPLGGEVPMAKGKRTAMSLWAIPMPRAEVTGEFSLRGHKHQFEQALGYHDHEYWKVNPTKKLFADDVVLGWYWGRLLAQTCAIIYRDFHLRGRHITSFIMALDGTIVHCSNNRIEVQPRHFCQDSELGMPFPRKITVRSTDKSLPFRMVLNSRQITERRDLLHGVNPLVSWLVKRLVCRPGYLGMLADATAELGHEQIRGTAVHEMIRFRGNGERLRLRIDPVRNSLSSNKSLRAK